MNPYLTIKSNIKAYLIKRNAAKANDYCKARKYGSSKAIKATKKEELVINSPNIIGSALSAKKRRFKPLLLDKMAP
ncbi:MAG: hypothetical protein ACI9P5_004474 [Saprospiraceae bacterium]|jgi:hypothetical protein|tara:strand:- start:84 stop:311 length:228 start_codon:yes stop_codon:yes gene_type:complete